MLKWVIIIATVGLLVCFAKMASSSEPVKKESKKPEKSIKIYLPSQVLVCYEGDQEVYRTRISSGKNWGYIGKTKYRKVYSVLGKDPAGKKARSIKRGKGGYNASTPWKIRLCDEPGHLVRIHDFNSVPKRPASHGCIRVPAGKCKWIYMWVNVGMPIYFTLEKEPEKPKAQIVPKKEKKSETATLKEVAQ